MLKDRAASKPNVVIIMADQLRFDAIGRYTPNITQLMDESVVFESAYCASPLCVPARGSFFTGKYPNVTGSIINPWLKQEEQHGNVHQTHENLYQLMEHQWDSWHTGKQHLFMDPKPEYSKDSETHWLQLEKRYASFLQERQKRKPGGTDFKGTVPEMAFGKVTRAKSYSIPTTGCYEEGFDYFFDGFILNDSLMAIRNRARTKPFLLNAMFVAPHPPFDVPEPWYSRVKEIELPENVGHWYDNQSPLQLYNLTGTLGLRYNREQWKDIWKVYLGLVSLFDDCVGALIEELKKEGMYENTLILFASDHGEMLGSHGLWQKMCMYEESVRTPLSIKFPDNFDRSRKQVEIPVSSVDVLPTLCDYLGFQVPKGISGTSLMPLIRGEAQHHDEPDRPVFIQFDGNGARGNFQRCVIMEEFKLIVDLFKDEIFIELYNRTQDPQETRNLAFNREYKDRIHCILSELRNHMKQTNDLLTLPENTYERFIENNLPFSK